MPHSMKPAAPSSSVNCNTRQNVPFGTGRNCTTKNNHSGVKSVTVGREETQRSPADTARGSRALSSRRSQQPRSLSRGDDLPVSWGLPVDPSQHGPSGAAGTHPFPHRWGPTSNPWASPRAFQLTHPRQRTGCGRSGTHLEPRHEKSVPRLKDQNFFKHHHHKICPARGNRTRGGQAAAACRATRQLLVMGPSR